MAGGFFTKAPSGKPGHHDNICIKHQGSLPLGYLELHSFFFLEEEMATHWSILAWRTAGTEEPGRLLSMGLHRVGHDWSDLAAAAAASFFALSSLPLKIFITILSILGYVPNTHFISSMISSFYFIFFFYNSWVLHILCLGTRKQMLVASTYGSSLFQWIGFSIICLMLSSVTESSAVSALWHKRSLGNRCFKSLI